MLPRIVFTHDWNQVLHGELEAGARFEVVYDANRLPEVRDTYQGRPTWSIMAFTQFEPPGGPLISKPLSGDGDLLTQEFEIPADAEELVMWFSNSGRSGRTFYDSAFGENYHFRFPRRDLEVVATAFAPPETTEGDGHGGLTVALSAALAVSQVAIEYTPPPGLGGFRLRESIGLEVTGGGNQRRIWSISEYRVPGRDGVDFSIHYEVGGRRFRDDNGGKGYAVRPSL